MDVVKDLGSDRCEVQVYYTLHFAVAGKGSSYQKSIEVSPSGRFLAFGTETNEVFVY